MFIMRAAIVAVVLLTVNLKVQSAPADLDRYKDERDELPQVEPAPKNDENDEEEEKLSELAQVHVCKNELMKLVLKAKECKKFLTPAAQKLAEHVRENMRFNNEVDTAGKELADGSLDTQGDSPEEKKVEEAEIMAFKLCHQGYKYRVNPHSSKEDVMLPFEAYEKDASPECEALITGFLKRNTHAGISD
ncbi:uncharacterized protein LOC111344796 isoform X1 [Stylophora pistillata]|uniref:Secreted protein n=1 Tax=Stylophora pistillata TaxID=50429 RepID=A0A2B4RCC8_STYPI|nr:uncharacterized protein LOC111344796 isoform X1 [Stylophora pistillata]PFX14429.1 hypothetical protein AWC38_SpisGene21414 [Stylophora pistillata]